MKLQVAYEGEISFNFHEFVLFYFKRKKKTISKSIFLENHPWINC